MFAALGAVAAGRRRNFKFGFVGERESDESDWGTS